MKLWIKLSIFIIILINLVIEIALFFIRPEIENFSITLLGEKLKSTAAASAVAVDGDAFEKLDFSDPNVAAQPAFQMIKNHLNMVKTNLKLKEDIYTLSMVNRNTAIFGIMTNQKNFTGDTLHLVNKIARLAINEAYNKNKCIYTDLYEDQYGAWLSGLAPIMNHKNQVVGVVQVDNSSSTVQTILDRINDTILLIRLILIPLTLFMSVMLAWVYTRPLLYAVKRINKIASGDYTENKKVKASGELYDLIQAAEHLRITILEQQQKIFGTIEELEKAKDKAEASNKIKGEFLSLISHEIRTPLHIILGNLGIIREEVEPQANQLIEERISSIIRGSERLIRTIEMMVLYSELSSGSYNKNKIIFDLHDVLCSLAGKYKQLIAPENILLDLNCSANTSLIKADKLLVEEALTQALDNAIKFTERGKVSLNMANNDEGISITVEDTGIGMSKEFLRELFKPFRQEDMTTSRPFEGNGLGLALTKKCCDFNGFSLNIQSEKNKGTKVEILIGIELLFQ